MKRLFIVYSVLVCVPAYPDAKQVEQLNNLIQQHNLASFKSAYNSARLSRDEQAQLLQYATAEDAYLKKEIKAQNKLPSRAACLGWGTLSLIGSALALSPFIVNGAECAYKKSITPLYDPEWYSVELLYSANNLVHTINPQNMFGGKNYQDIQVSLSALYTLGILVHHDFVRPVLIAVMYAACGCGGTVLAHTGMKNIGNTFAARKNLTLEREQVQQIIQLLSGNNPMVKIVQKPSKGSL